MNRKKVLLVDDEETILDTYSLLLSEKGYSVVTVDSGRKAFEKFCQQSFDLVITDLAMMDGDGFTLLKEIKSKSPDTPVIVFTGTRSRVVKSFVSSLGAYALIEKPCRNEILISCIKSSLTRNKERMSGSVLKERR